MGKEERLIQQLELEEAKKIINFKSYEEIDESVAERQLNVTLTGFNHLIQPKNKYLYIGDEVGLGKTYIALGIMSLLRHFSKNKSHKDAIIVPKANLQYKWQKEINNFIKNNYLLLDSRVKTILKTPIALNSAKDNETLFSYLKVISEEFPAYYIYRMSSFSISVNSQNWKGWENGLKDRIKDNDLALKFFRIGQDLGYFDEIYSEQHLSRLKRFYAYLLNLKMKPVDCLVVDEAHNYRKGNHEESISARNAVTSCLLGIKNSYLSVDIFKDIPELESHIKSKAKKVILLSATPMSTNLSDVVNQIDCFVDQHLLYSPDNSKIKKDLNSFMIRGNMNLKIGEKKYSRNMYRHEHRNGNVDENEASLPQTIHSNKEAITLGLFQSNLLRELKSPKYNNSFEIGMLAGFETFKKDSKRVLNKKMKEYEESNKRGAEISIDTNVISNLVDSYQEIVEKEAYPPHPKQDMIVDEIFKSMINGKKSLIFVRRVSSAYEIEQRLLKKYEEKFIFERISKSEFLKRYQSKDLENLNLAFIDRQFENRKKEIFVELYLKIKKKVYTDFHLLFLEHKEFTKLFMNFDDFIPAWFDFIYSHELNEEGLENKFVNLIKTHAKRKSISEELRNVAVNYLFQSQDEWIHNLKAIIDEDEEDLKQNGKSENLKYFYNKYFSEGDGLSFKRRVYSRDWFEFNYFLINKKYKLFDFDIRYLKELDFSAKTSSNQKKITKKENQKFDDYTDLFKSSIINEPYDSDKEKNNISNFYTKSTFLTRLVFEKCNVEFSAWINKIRIDKNPDQLFIEIDILESILKNIFRNGSGLLPTYIADKAEGKLTDNLIDLISDNQPFNFVLEEIKYILKDYSLLRNTNFSDAENIDHQIIKINSLFRGLSPVIGTSGEDNLDKKRVAAQFRLPGYPYVLITTDVLKEGEDLHTYCKNIYHYGIAWNPIDMEQRTGRIDRIGAYALRKLKSNSPPPNFRNKVQVFYPYLSDTIEIYQVIKVLESMDKFIDTFYDFTIEIPKESTTTIDTPIHKIPPQRTTRLNSKYEFDKFVGIDKYEPLKIDTATFNNKDFYTRKFLELLNFLKKRHIFYYEPQFVIDSFRIQGVINLVNRDSRYGPFWIHLGYDQILGEYIYKLYSKICKDKKQVIKEDLRLLLEKQNLELLNFNDNLMAKTSCRINENLEKVIELIEHVINQADILEEMYFGEDDKSSI